MPIFPGAVATDADLYRAVNSKQTTLSTPLTIDAVTVVAVSTTGFPTAGAIVIESEVIFYTNISGTSFTGCTRGADGTTAATHTAGVPLSAAIIAFHHNGLLDEVEAVEQNLMDRFGEGSETIEQVVYDLTTFDAPPFSAAAAQHTYDELTDFYMMGFNLVPGTVATKVVSDKHQIVWEYCYDFYDGAVNLCEWNMNFVSADGLTTRRPMKFDIQLDNNLMTWWFAGTVFDLVETNDTDRFFRSTPSGLYQNGFVQVGGNTGAKLVWNGGILKVRDSADSSYQNFATGDLTVNGDVFSDTDNSKDIGTALIRFSNVFTRTISAGANALSLKTTDGADIRFYGGSLGADEFVRITDTGKLRLFNLTASTVPYADANKDLVSSAVTPTELGYVSGVSSAIQTQIDAKAPSAWPTFSGTITTPLTASRAVVTGASSELAVAATTATEIGYVSGVTSAIQTQMNLKAPLASPTFTGTVTLPNSTFTVDMTNYSSTSTVTGWSSFAEKLIYYAKVGKEVKVWFSIDGTSNAVSASFTLPFTSANTVGVIGSIRAKNNGSFVTTPAMYILGANSSTVNMYIDYAGNDWNSANGKTCQGWLTYWTA